MEKNYRKTLLACYLGFITQAITANFAPLLFLKFHTDYSISLGQIALIPTAFFLTQLVIDVFCARFVDSIGYRRSVVASEIFSALGLAGLAFTYLLSPMIDDFYERFPKKTRMIVCIILIVIFIADVIFSAFVPNVGEGVTSGLV